MIIGSRQELTAQLAVEVVVPDLPAAVAFYRSLGFELERETPTFVTLRWEQSFLFLASNSGAVTGPRWTNVRVIVPDVDALWTHAHRLGLQVINAIGDRPYGLRDFTLRDPAGFEVRFAQVL